MNIEERVDRLEAQNRNLRRGLLLLVLVVPLACSALVRQDKKPKVTKFDVIEANEVRTKWVYATDLKMVNGDTNIHLSASRDQAVGIFQHSYKHVTLSVLGDAFLKKLKREGMGMDSPSVSIRNDLDADQVNLVTTKHGPQVQLWTCGRLSAELGPTQAPSEAQYRRCYLRFYDTKGHPLRKATVIHQVPK